MLENILSRKDLITLSIRGIGKEFSLRMLLIRESSIWKLRYEEQMLNARKIRSDTNNTYRIQKDERISKSEINQNFDILKTPSLIAPPPLLQ